MTNKINSENPITLKEILNQLEALGNEKIRNQNLKNGAGDNQFGVKLGDLRKLAKKIKTNPELAFQLWETGNIDARFLAILLIEPKKMVIQQIEKMIRSISFSHVADWFIAYIVKLHPEKEVLRQKWMLSDHPMLARAGWSLTAERVSKNPEGLELEKFS